MSRRTEQVGSVIRSIVAGAIRKHLSDPRIEPLTSITRVEVSPDFSIATVHVSVMATEARRVLCVRALQHAAGRLRAMLADGLTTRTVPRLVFRLDESVRKGAEMVAQLDRLAAERGDLQPWEVEESDAPEGAPPSETQDSAAAPNVAGKPAGETAADVASGSDSVHAVPGCEEVGTP